METFNEALQKRDFVLTAELNLVRESDAASIVDQATVLATHTDAIQIPDNPNARIHMTPLAASSILLKHGIEAIAQLSCRDRNRVALENELLSLGAMGVRNLLLLRGDDLSEDHRPRLKQVFEGVIGYFFLIAMTLTSFKFGRKRLSPKQWKKLHKIGIYSLWIYAFSVYWWALYYYPDPLFIDYVYYWGGFLAWGLRAAAWRKNAGNGK